MLEVPLTHDPEVENRFCCTAFCSDAQRGGGGGVLHISSDGDDLMGAKIKTHKIPRASNEPLPPQEIPGPKVNPKTSHADISEPYKFPEGIK